MTRTRYISAMVPLSTGQSKQVVVQATPYDEALCESCKRYGCVRTPSGERCVVVECPDCALDGWFTSSYGFIIRDDISLDVLVQNESKYALTPSSWLSAYIDGTLYPDVLSRPHSDADISNAMETLIDSTQGSTHARCSSCSSCSSCSNCSSPCICSFSLQSEADGSPPAGLISPKLINRVRRILDVTERMEEMSLDCDDNRDDSIATKRLKRG